MTFGFLVQAWPFSLYGFAADQYPGPFSPSPNVIMPGAGAPYATQPNVLPHDTLVERERARVNTKSTHNQRSAPQNLTDGTVDKMYKSQNDSFVEKVKSGTAPKPTN